MMMKTLGNSSSKLSSSLSISLELEVAEVLTDLANPSEINTHLQEDAHPREDVQKSSISFWSERNIESTVQSSPLHLALWPDNKVGW